MSLKNTSLLYTSFPYSNQQYYLCLVVSLFDKTPEHKSEDTDLINAQEVLENMKNITNINQVMEVGRVSINKQKVLRSASFNQHVNKLKLEYSEAMPI